MSSVTTLFDPAELNGLPRAAARLLGAGIKPGTATSHLARIEMHGHIKLGRWLPFSAVEELDPHHRFEWAARVAGGVISGADRYQNGEGAMRWKLLGTIPLVRASGPDVTRSAIGRLAGESIWLPTALLPRHGVHWNGNDDTTASASFKIDEEIVTVTYHVPPDGPADAVALQRWGDPDGTGTWGWHPFGGELSAYRTFSGITIPTTGRIGWHFGTDRWGIGEFFRFTITDMQLLERPPAQWSDAGRMATRPSYDETLNSEHLEFCAAPVGASGATTSSSRSRSRTSNSTASTRTCWRSVLGLG